MMRRAVLALRSVSMLRRTLAIVATLFAMLTNAQRVDAQSPLPPKAAQRPPYSVAIGPRLLEYRIDCTDSSTCRVQCYQHGVKVIDRGHIAKSDQLRMLASTSADGEILPQWIEVRPADGNTTQTVLLSRDTTCDLTSLIISPETPP